MTMTTGFARLAFTALALLLLTAPALHAAAKQIPAAAGLHVTCDKPTLRAEGRRSDPGSASYKERMARKYSIRKWEQLASELYGPNFAYWRMAGERNIECEHYSEAWLSGRVSCVASGKPCAKR